MWSCKDYVPTTSDTWMWGLEDRNKRVPAEIPKSEAVTSKEQTQPLWTIRVCPVVGSWQLNNSTSDDTSLLKISTWHQDIITGLRSDSNITFGRPLTLRTLRALPGNFYNCLQNHKMTSIKRDLPAQAEMPGPCLDRLLKISKEKTTTSLGKPFQHFQWTRLDR